MFSVSTDKPPRMISPRIAKSKPFFGKAGDGQRGDRRPAHGPHVIDRIERGDAAVIERVVDNRREKIERLHQREIVAQSIHSGVVRFVETDQQIGIERLFLKPAQHLSEDARGQLSRSTRARNHFGQTHGSFSFRVGLIWNDSASHRALPLSIIVSMDTTDVFVFFVPLW